MVRQKFANAVFLGVLCPNGLCIFEKEPFTSLLSVLHAVLFKHNSNLEKVTS